MNYNDLGPPPKDLNLSPELARWLFLMWDRVRSVENLSTTSISTGSITVATNVSSATVSTGVVYATNVSTATVSTSIIYAVGVSSGYVSSGTLKATTNLSSATISTGLVYVGSGAGTQDTVNIAGDVDIKHTAAESDDHALEIEVNANDLGDVRALDIVYQTGAQPIASDAAVILINIDDTGALGGEVIGLEVLTTAQGSDGAIALLAGAQVAPLEHLSGTFTNADTVLNKTVDVTAALASGGAGNVSTFVADNDTFTIGEASKFEELEVSLDTPSSGAGVAPTFEYSDGVGSWVSFTPTDGTNGFRNTGVIIWDDATVSSWAVGTGGEFLIRITRTRNSLTTTPIFDQVQVSIDAQFGWDKNADLTVNNVSALKNLSSATISTATLYYTTLSPAVTATEVGLWDTEYDEEAVTVSTGYNWLISEELIFTGSSVAAALTISGTGRLHVL